MRVTVSVFMLVFLFLFPPLSGASLSSSFKSEVRKTHLGKQYTLKFPYTLARRGGLMNDQTDKRILDMTAADSKVLVNTSDDYLYKISSFKDVFVVKEFKFKDDRMEFVMAESGSGGRVLKTKFWWTSPDIDSTCGQELRRMLDAAFFDSSTTTEDITAYNEGVKDRFLRDRVRNDTIKTYLQENPTEIDSMFRKLYDLENHVFMGNGEFGSLTVFSSIDFDDFKGKLYVIFRNGTFASSFNTLQTDRDSRAKSYYSDNLIPLLKQVEQSLGDLPHLEGIAVQVVLNYYNFVSKGDHGSDTVEFFIPLDQIRRFGKYDISSQQLAANSMVLINSNRVELFPGVRADNQEPIRTAAQHTQDISASPESQAREAAAVRTTTSEGLVSRAPTAQAGMTDSASQPPSTEPSGSPTVDETGEIRDFVYEWLAAWRGKQIDSYMSFYSYGFVSGRYDYDGWRKKKSRLFQDPANLTIKAENLSIEPYGSSAKVEFVQRYSSSTVSDVGIKTLKLVKSNDNWLIVTETWRAME